MVSAIEIADFRRRLEADPENREARRSFHENFEWLEGYWRSQFGDHYFDVAWDKYGDYFWEHVREVQQVAQVIAGLPPVGNNKDKNYEPSMEVKQATKLLQTLNETPKHHFRALMLIVWQIRNNLFHGKKMELTDERQYQRNKDLVMLATEVTEAILGNLVEAEIACR